MGGGRVRRPAPNLRANSREFAAKSLITSERPEGWEEHVWGEGQEERRQTSTAPPRVGRPEWEFWKFDVGVGGGKPAIAQLSHT